MVSMKHNLIPFATKGRRRKARRQAGAGNKRAGIHRTIGMKQSGDFDFSWVCFRMRPLLVHRYFVSRDLGERGVLGSRDLPGVWFVLDIDVMCLFSFLSLIPFFPRDTME